MAPGHAAVLHQLHGHDVGQRAVGDHHRRGVDAGVAHDPLEALGRVDDLARLGLGVVDAAQVGLLGEVLRERLGAPHHRLGDQLGQPVARAVVEPQHARGVARGVARQHLAEGDDLRHRLLAVLVLHVAHHPRAALHREVDVDVRHRHPLGVEEALEQQAVGQRVDLGDVEAVGDQRAGRRAAARAHGDAVLLGVADEVPDDQEVGREAHLLDHAQLHLEPLERLGRRRVAVAAAQTLLREAAQVVGHGLALGRREARDQHLAELDLHLAALGDLQAGGERLRPLGEVARHLVRALEEELVGVERQLRRRQRALGLHAQQSAVVVEVLAAEVMDVPGGHQRPAQLARDPHDALVGLVLLGDAVLLDLEEDVVGAEHADQGVGVRARLVRVVLHQAAAEAPLQAAGERDHALGMARQQVEVDVRLAAPVALEVARRGELDQVAEARVGAGQQREVVALVAHLLAAAIVDEVGLQAHDRLDPVLAAGLVVLHRAVHHPVVGQPQRRLPVGGRALGQRVDAAGAVEDRVLGVDVEMGEAHPGPPNIRPGIGRTEASAAPPLRVCGVGASRHRAHRPSPARRARSVPVRRPALRLRLRTGSSCGRTRPTAPSRDEALAHPARGELASGADGYPAGVSHSRERESAARRRFADSVVFSRDPPEAPRRDENPAASNT